ncbi:MAG: uroporphyrinogen decarboxylase family protein, partial [Candidatus Caldatribacteriota bacterium]|nr:uroporphyrinogen decarboxylase family protein [Candidatus Caldatribacteriota bacterium]
MNREIKKLLKIVEEKKRIDPQGKDRIADVLENKEVDVLPLIFWRPQNTSVPGKTYNMEEQFYDKEKMLYGHLEEIADCAQNAFDAPICIRPNFGTIFIPAMFGLKYELPKDTFAWITSHLTKGEIKKFKIPHLSEVDMMKKAIEYFQFFKEKLPEWIHIYLPDTLGPFEIAHSVYGDNIFYEIYDDPSFIHYLLDLCTEIYIQVTEKLKKVIGEERGSCYHGHALVRGIYLRNGGTRISEDSATLISPKHIDEFVIPYDKEALNAFGGGFVHFCGENDYLLESFLKLDEVRAINLGNPEMYDFDITMQKFVDYRKCYFGLWPKEKSKTLEEYIFRIKQSTDGGRRGL